MLHAHKEGKLDRNVVTVVLKVIIWLELPASLAKKAVNGQVLCLPA